MVFDYFFAFYTDSFYLVYIATLSKLPVSKTFTPIAHDSCLCLKQTFNSFTATLAREYFCLKIECSLSKNATVKK